MASLTTKDERLAALATALARAVRRGEVAVQDATRVLRHELRRRNTKRALEVPVRSRGAQEVIERYAAESRPIPTNDSPDALHCDHVFSLTAGHLERLVSQADWLEELPRLDAVVCLTAAENYSLLSVERGGLDGWGKYAMAGIELLEPRTS